MAKADVTAAFVRSALDFTCDPPVWRVKPSPRLRAGTVAGAMWKDGYRRICIAGKSYAAHRLLWLAETGEWPAGTLDHINGIRSDNRFENLRDVTLAINGQNRRFVAGCTKIGKRWMAQIGLAGRTYYLGVFDTPAEAKAAYLAKKREIHEGCTS